MQNPSAPVPRFPPLLPLLLGSVSLLVLWFLTRSWEASILDRYGFRQLQTALSTYWINHDGWHLDYLTPLFGPPWSVPMEFPTYQLCVAALTRMTGWPLEQVGRLCSVLFLLATLPAVYDLLELTGLERTRRMLVLGFILTTPVYLFYGRTFMIETAALCLSVWFLALLRRSLRQPDAVLIIGTTLFAGLAALTKVTTFSVFAWPALALGLWAWREPLGPQVTRIRQVFAAVLPALVALTVSYWWVRRGDFVKNSNPFTGYLNSHELRHWTFGTWALRGEPSYWLHAQEIITRHVLTEGAGVLALLCLPFVSSRIRWIAAIAFLGFASGPLIFGNLYHVHDYYYCANALLLTGTVGLLLASLWDDVRLPRGVNALLVLLALGCQIQAYYRGLQTHHGGQASPPELAAILRATVPPGGVLLIYGDDWNPLLPYYAQRRALMVPEGREDETNILEQILARLPPHQRVAAMIMHGKNFRQRPKFISERAARFGFSARPFAEEGEYDLYLPENLLVESAARLQNQSFLRAHLLATPTDDAFSAVLHAQAPGDLTISFAHPAPYSLRTKYGFLNGSLNGRPILNAHAPSELFIHPPTGSARFRAEMGVLDGAFAPGQPAITDGISVEVLELDRLGLKHSLYRRELHPATEPADRGPQSIALELNRPFSGDLVLRIGTGPKGNPTNDWAYWSLIEIH